MGDMTRFLVAVIVLAVIAAVITYFEVRE